MSKMKRVIDKPIRMVSAFAVLVPEPLSFVINNKAENRLPMISNSMKTIKILTNTGFSKGFWSLCGAYE